jgi:hypothetical protein
MIELMRAGGIFMIFVLGFGLITFGAAIHFAIRPDLRRVETVRALTLATLFSVAAGVIACIAKVGSTIPRIPEWASSPKIHLLVMEGISESMAPGILGFSLLALAWLVMAVGHRRLAHEL